MQEIVDTCDFFLGEGRRLYGQTVPSEMPDKQLFTFRDAGRRRRDHHRRATSPSRCPSWYLVPALLCGNAVVWKPAEYAPALGEALGRCSCTAACPTGVLNVVQCRRPERPSRASSGRSTRGWSTRSASPARRAVGSEIGELCGRHLQSPCLELGGKNPMVVMPDADLDLAVEGALFSGFGTAGQRCTSLGTVIVHERLRRLHAPLHAAVEGAAIGDPTEDVLYGPMIDERFAERFEEWLGLVHDHHTVHGSTGTGRITPATRARDSWATPTPGIYCHPTIVDGVTADDDLYAHRDLRPARRAWRTFGDFDEAIELANGHGYGLSAAIYTTDPQVGLPLPRARDRRDGERQQLHVAAPRRTCRSAETASRATAPASRASGCSTSSPAGSR